jgi:hypothetical protein
MAILRNKKSEKKAKKISPLQQQADSNPEP